MRRKRPLLSPLSTRSHVRVRSFPLHQPIHLTRGPLPTSDTEIDWQAYMSEVRGFADGERDYTKLSGSTGPLVYPAGFVYLFDALRRLTDDGANLRAAQYFFAAAYGVMQWAAAAVFCDASAPLAVVAAIATSRRLHSIFVLRLFNDGLAMIPAMIAVLMAARGRVRKQHTSPRRHPLPDRRLTTFLSAVVHRSRLALRWRLNQDERLALAARLRDAHVRRCWALARCSCRTGRRRRSARHWPSFPTPRPGELLFAGV